MRTAALAITACLLADATSAQSIVVPSQAAMQRPIGSVWYVGDVFYSTTSVAVPHDSRAQMMYATSDIPVPAGLWTSMDIRRPGQNASNSWLGNDNPPATTNLVLTISVTATPLSGLTDTFANNHGPSPITVRSGPLNLPARPGTNVWPQPWENIPFSTPMLYVGTPGGTLVVDLMQTNNSSTSPWFLEAQLRKEGMREDNGTLSNPCQFGRGNSNNRINFTSPQLGGNWRVTYHNLMTGTSGFAWIGSQGIGGSYGGWPLPIDLGPLGAPGCNVRASVDFVVGLTAVGASATWPNVPIPNDPSLTGKTFFDHSLWMDSSANAFGGVVGWSSKWTIGDGIGAPAALLSAVGVNATNVTGTLALGTGVTLQFHN